MRVFVIFVGVYLCFILESVLSGIFGRWFTPNLLLLLIVYLNLTRGIRYSILAAFLAGILKDSYSAGPMGVSIFSLVACAYLTTFIKAYVYQSGSPPARVLLVFVMSLINIAILYLLQLMTAEVDFGEVFRYVLLPEVTATCLATGYAFKRFRECALKLSI
jgi:rod shape-determining protein MreD